MSRNSLYTNEIATAGIFLEEHKEDIKLKEFLKDMDDMKWLTVNEKISRCYSFMKKNYPDCSLVVSIGMAFLLEK